MLTLLYWLKGNQVSTSAPSPSLSPSLYPKSLNTKNNISQQRRPKSKRNTQDIPKVFSTILLQQQEQEEQLEQEQEQL